MAGYSVTDANNNLLLEMSLNAFTEFQPQLQIDIRQRPQQGVQTQIAPIASAPVLVYQLPLLIANIMNPMESAMLQINNKNGSINVGRMANDFLITNNNGSFKTVLSDSQWNDTYTYVKTMYENASIIKEINRNVRMQIINVLREVGIDTPVNGKFRATPWYDYKIDQRLLGNGNNNTNFSNGDGASSIGATYNGFSQGARPPIQGASMPQMNHPAGGSHPAATMGMPSGTAMPPMPSGNTQHTQHTQQVGINPLASGNNAMPGATSPNMGMPMPPIPNPSNGGDSSSAVGGSAMSLSSGLQDMLNNAFQSNNG